MKELEQKAREYRESRYWLTDRESDCGPEEIEPAYLAGAAEVMRWRKCSEEMPGNGEVVLALDAFAFSCGEGEIMQLTMVGNELMDRFGDRWEDMTHWRPIGPLPTTTDCKSEVG